METALPARSQRIRVLPTAVAEQIAAGEVVERPASVVKELIENSIDAGSRHISIELTDGGIGSIVVVDDGEGMSPEDAVVAFRRHATSKIATSEDLLRVRTLGFRGEALAAISAVADVRLVTRPPDREIATQVHVHGGTVADVRETGAPVGTRLEVKDLFFNTPARRKFLKTPGTEIGHVTELVTRCALACPHIAFTLRHAGRTVAEYPPAPQPEERLTQVFGRERAATMRGLSQRSAAGDIRGWVTEPHSNFPTARHVYTYVNGRFVKDRLVTHALLAGYSTLLMQGRYPGAVLFVGVDPEEVDVNVHPAKAEVRFRRSGLVHELITRGVGERLRAAAVEAAAAAGLDPEVVARGGLRWPRRDGDPAALAAPVSPAGTGLGSDSHRATSRADGGQMSLASEGGLLSGGGDAARAAGETSGSESAARLPLRLGPHVPLRLVDMPRRPDAPNAAETSSSLPAAIDPTAGGFFSGLRVVGQIFEGYLVCQSDTALVLIDQHAAHERVAFERLRHAYAAGGVARQSLLVPAVVELRPREAGLLAEAQESLQRIGFEIEPFGNQSVAIRAVPALLADANPATLLQELLEELGEVGSSRKLTAAAEDVLATLACHSAVRIGQTLSTDQIRALLMSMDGIDFAGNCPHGRPAFLTFPRAELERRFRRT